MNDIKQREEVQNVMTCFSWRCGNKVSEGNRCSNDVAGKGLERSRNLLFKCCNHPATVRRSINGKFLSSDDIWLIDIDKEIANTILARYWKGIEADSSNCVIEEYE